MLPEELNGKVKELGVRSQELKAILRIEQKEKRLQELEKKISDPNLWQDQNRAKLVMQEKSQLEKEIGGFVRLGRGIEEAKGLIEIAGDDDLKSIEEELSSLIKISDEVELTALLGGPYDGSNAIMAINAG